MFHITIDNNFDQFQYFCLHIRVCVSNSVTHPQCHHSKIISDNLWCIEFSKTKLDKSSTLIVAISKTSHDAKHFKFNSISYELSNHTINHVCEKITTQTSAWNITSKVYIVERFKEIIPMCDFVNTWTKPHKCTSNIREFPWTFYATLSIYQCCLVNSIW